MRVEDLATFLEFVEALIDDREQDVLKEKEQRGSQTNAGRTEWENETIEDYLFGALRWAQDSGQMSAAPSWKAFATFLYCGKIYE